MTSGKKPQQTMPKKITITCPSCSATLATPISTAGKTLLCPKCQTGIAVPMPVEPAMETDANRIGLDSSTGQNLRTERAVVPRQQTGNTRRRIFQWVSGGLAILLTIGVLVWGLDQLLAVRHARTIVTLLKQQQFDQVLALEPDHIEALIGRARRLLEQRQPDVAGAIQDLKHLERLVPDHPIHNEILPALSMARSREHAQVGRTAGALIELEQAKQLGADGARLDAVTQELITGLLKQAQKHVQNQRFREAIEDCNHIQNLGGQSDFFRSIQTAACDGFVERATTNQEFEEAIDALKMLQESSNSVLWKQNLHGLYVRRSQKEFSQGHVESAIDLLKMSVEYGRLDADSRAFGTTLADSALVAFETELADVNRNRARVIVDLLEKEAIDPETLLACKTRFASALLSQVDIAISDFDAERSDMNRDRALLMIGLLEKEAFDAEIIVARALRLSKLLLSESDSRIRDDDLNFVVRHVTQALINRTDPFPEPALPQSLSRALGKRSFEHLREGRIAKGLRDVASSIEFDPQRREKLVTRLRTLPVNIRDQLPEDILGTMTPAATDSFWTQIPANAEAISAVRRMQEFSDKVDEVARLMGNPSMSHERVLELWFATDGRVTRRKKIPPPWLLRWACRKSGIMDGLDRNGTLGWGKVPVAADAEPGATGMIFFVPTLDFLTMIQPLRAKEDLKDREPGTDLYSVKMNDASGRATSVNPYGVFAFDEDAEALSGIDSLDQDIQTELIPFDQWDQYLDAYFVITRQGLHNGLSDFKMPFSTPVLDSLIATVRGAMVESIPVPGQEALTWFQQFAIGLEVQPDSGIGVRSRFWMQPEIDLEEFLAENTGGRERALNLLPNVPILLAVGGPVSPKMCEGLSNAAALLFPEQPKPQIQISSVQIALLPPDLPAIDAEQSTDNFFFTAVISRLLIHPVMIVRTKDSQTALECLEARIAAVANPAQNANQKQPPGMIPTVERVELDGIPVLRIKANSPPNELVDFSSMLLLIAAPNEQTLVLTSGNDAQLSRALAAFRGAGNLSESETVLTAVRMLPDATSWLAVLDLKTIVREILKPYRLDSQHSNGVQAVFAESLAKEFTIDSDESIPVALGVSWQESSLDIELSLPKEIFPFAGRIWPFLSFFCLSEK